MDCDRCPDEDTPKCNTCFDNPDNKEKDNVFLRYLTNNCIGCCQECKEEIKSICNRMTAITMGYKMKEIIDKEERRISGKEDAT